VTLHHTLSQPLLTSLYRELKSTYFAKSGKTTIFISALGKINIEELRKAIYKKAAPVHHSIYPNWMKVENVGG